MEQKLKRHEDYAQELERAVQCIRDHHGFVLTTHLNPDGDGLGCESAMQVALTRMGKKVTVINAHPTPELYQFLPGSERFIVAPTRIPLHDVTIYFECPDAPRAGDIIRIPEHATLSINLDHHVFNARYGTINLIDPTAAAVGEQLWDLLQALDYPRDQDVGIGLYTAIATDTGHFKYSSVTPRTHRIIAELLAHGVDPGQINDQLYERVPAAGLQLLALALCTVQYNQERNVGWFCVTRRMLAETGAQESYTENFVNYVRAVEGVQVAILFRETAEGKIKVSFRSRGKVDVSVIAHRFGGGGHQRAAGALVAGSMEDVQKRVLAEVEAEKLSRS